jgi:hypothetical protein
MAEVDRMNTRAAIGRRIAGKRLDIEHLQLEWDLAPLL